MQCKSYEWKSNIRRSTREELSLAESSSDRGEYEVHPGADLVNGVARYGLHPLYARGKVMDLY